MVSDQYSPGYLSNNEARDLAKSGFEIMLIHTCTNGAVLPEPANVMSIPAEANLLLIEYR